MMERTLGTGGRARTEPGGTGVKLFQFSEELKRSTLGSGNGNSFTALLELPPTQAMELLHSPVSDQTTVAISGEVKNELFESPSNLKCDPTVQKSTKRKERENKVKGTSKKKKNSEDRELLPYVHVRARRGQATDSHSLAERARREKINARMKLLQELVPGCNKISGTALVLDEIINHVQSLQRQVEFLSMRLAAVSPSIEINLDGLLAAERGSFMDSNCPNMLTPLVCPEALGHGYRQHYQPKWQFDAYHQPVCFKEEENHPNFITPEHSLLSYDSSANSVSLHSNQLKMEL